MMCRNPFLRGDHAFPCGQCMPCRFNKRREWTHRVMLEASLHGDNAFVTLTYDDAHLPRVRDMSNGLATLRPKDLQDWLKRFRRLIAPIRVRFYAVGEYGDDSWRPHYHVALFGYPSCQFGMSRYSRSKSRCCVNCDRVADTWLQGNVFLGGLSAESASYVAGYVTKKMTGHDDFRLNGREPEFARMSLKPGIGADMMHEVGSVLMTHGLDSAPDVPSALRHGKRILPLGRYLRRELRSIVGKEKDAPKETLEEAAKEVRAVRDVEWNNPSPDFGKRVKQALSGASDVKVLQLEKRQSIRKQRRSL